MNNKVTINPSIAAIVEIDSIGKSEVVPIYFTAEENWTGTYTFKIWNSDKKNDEIEVPETFTITVDEEEITVDTLKVQEKQMTLTIAPAKQNITEGSFYFEITHDQSNRIIFKGEKLIIVK